MNHSLASISQRVNGSSTTNWPPTCVVELSEFKKQVQTERKTTDLIDDSVELVDLTEGRTRVILCFLYIQFIITSRV